MRIYLDNCCYNRPYDDQNYLRISLESQAKIRIQSLIKEGQFELVSSYMLQYESSRNPYESRRNTIESYIKANASTHVGYEQKSIIDSLVGEIEDSGVKNGDAVHVACAICAGCDYLLTTDDRLLKYKTEKIQIVNPVDFIRLEVEKDE